ncbi:hypothetical protein EV196_10110 [Mariniflexile fucanivorans]|uniref:Uncharacterized protein n=1 Tax=Mariniflexile fucanivorans TaxID=264023 RepID=A0A4R1RQK6_9FLAO|nr:hypothetical protein [Mariniflexile fucanivorans]TCL68596.1 hypothetical protein EV196_10110 [Mariniflexile fucanivorans]
MKTYYSPLVKVFFFIILVSCNNKNTKTTVNHPEIAQNSVVSSKISSESTITVNGQIYNLETDPCVLQDNNDHKLLTFKGKNDDMDYNLSITLGTTTPTFENGNYILSYDENQVNFLVLVFYTEDGAYANTTSTPVVYTKNGNSSTVSCNNISLEHNLQESPNMTISFKLTCNME